MGQNICGVLSKSDPVPISNMEEVSDLDFNRNSTYRKVEQFSITICKDREISVQFNSLIQRLLSMGQHHLLDKIKEFSTSERKNAYLFQLDQISHEMEVIDSLYHHFVQKSTETEDNVDILRLMPNIMSVADIPYTDYFRQYRTGLKLISHKQVALVIMAGGKNLRFGQDTSKSLCDLGLPSQLSLFDIIGRKLKTLKDIAFANSPKEKKSSFQIIIFANNINQKQIKLLWQKNDNFGFNESDVIFLQQGQYPITNLKGKLLLKEDHTCHLFPCGSGEVILKLMQHKLIDKLIEENYKYVHFIGTDDLLVKPLDPLFLGIASENKRSINQKCVHVKKNDPEFFRILNINGRSSLIEYSDIENIMKQKKYSSVTHNEEYRHGRQEGAGFLDEAPAFMYSTLVTLDFLQWFQKRQELKFAFQQKFRVMKRYVEHTEEITQVTEEQQPEMQDNRDGVFEQIFNGNGTNGQTLTASSSMNGHGTQQISLNQQNMQNLPTHHIDSIEQPYNVLIFEKVIGDLLELTDDVNFLRVNDQEEFAPIIYRQGKYSPNDAVIKMSNLHKKWLHLDRNNLSSSVIQSQIHPIFKECGLNDLAMVEVCPFVSYGGEGLENYSDYLRRNIRQQAFPLYINLENVSQFEFHSQNEEKRVETPTVYHSFENLATLENPVTNLNQSPPPKESDLIQKSFNHVQGLSHSSHHITTRQIRPTKVQFQKDDILLEIPQQIFKERSQSPFDKRLILKRHALIKANSLPLQ